MANGPMKPLFHPALDDVTVEGIMHALSDPVRLAIYADIVGSGCEHGVHYVVGVAAHVLEIEVQAFLQEGGHLVPVGTFGSAGVDHITERPTPTVRAGALSYGSLQTVVKTLTQALSTSPYLLGDRFTAADLYLTAQIGFGLATKAFEPTPTA